MPPIRSINCNNGLHLRDSNGDEFQFTDFDIPNGMNTPQEVEDYINNIWIPSILENEYKLEVHVFSLSPFQLTVYSTDKNNAIPPNWWLE